MNDSNKIIFKTKNWISKVIIAHGICPFAKNEFDNNRIHYEIIHTPSLKQQLETLILQCEEMNINTVRETSLLIFSQSLSNFEDYLDALALSNELLSKQGYEGVYQLASFHPDYCFADVAKDDPSNYTNRSPYPMFHILRESSIEKALRNYPNPEKIPERNIQLTQELGLNRMKQLLSNC